ncbi:hypothetical protein N7535_002036 [Penicillium sp. DV-2018c]|nr:hypothetical protein N7461_004720 [Penicillium sp. DV-2018c]KAJ5583416.1 hypothetical protein N7535_002036 [Penicillium sp. DV-2018c]
MLKSIISTGQQLTRASRNQSIRTSSLATPTATRTPFSTTQRCQTEDGPGVQNREELSPERSETSKSGTDAEVANHPAAFDPNNTSPESELKATEEESKREGKTDSPLDVSPANSDVSAWKRDTDGGPDRNQDRGASSSRGAAKKNRGIHVKEDGTHVGYRS